MADTPNSSTPRPLSAAATLSNRISALKSKRILPGDSIIRSRAGGSGLMPYSSYLGPGALPTETLLTIYQLVFQECVDWYKTETDTSYPKDTIVWLEDDPSSPSIFPYGLASVCTRWLHILSGVAVYWTRQVITVDCHATSPAVIRMLLEWAGDLPLELSVTRNPGVSGDTDIEECTRVRDVLDLFRPHIPRIWSFSFNVRYTSSLPALWRERGISDCLQVVTLISGCSSTSGLPLLELHPPEDSKNHTPLETPFVRRVAMSGLCCREAQTDGRNHWFHDAVYISICGEHRASDGSRVSLHKYLCQCN